MNPLQSQAVIDYEDDSVAVIRHDARTLPLSSAAGQIGKDNCYER